MTIDIPLTAAGTLARLRQAVDQLDQATAAVVARRTSERRERDELAHRIDALLSARDGVTGDLDQLIARLRAVLDES